MTKLSSRLKMISKIILMTFIVLFLISSKTKQVKAETSFELGDFSYTITSKTEVSVTGYLSGKTSVNIPGEVTYNGIKYSVRSIGYYAFRNNTSIKTVTIGEGVEEIGDLAFYNCSSLTSVRIPSTFTTTDAAYLNEEYSAGPFGNCKMLTDVVLAEGIKSIPAYTFKSCNGITSVKIPNSVSIIGESAFEYCTNLKTVDIPDSVRTIDTAAYKGCIALTTVNFGKGVKIIESFAFSKCVNLTNIVLPPYITELNGRAFEYDTAITSIIIPRTLDFLGESYSSEDGVGGPFIGCTNLTKLEFEFGTTIISSNVINSCKTIKEVFIPETVSKIDVAAFSDCSNLMTVHMPNSITNIEQFAFSGCKKLTNVVLPTRLKYLGGGAFNNCTSIKTIVIPKSMEKADYFYDLDSDQDYGPFGNCTALKTVSFENGLVSIPQYIMMGCYELTTINIPSSVTTIGESAFDRCTSLTKYNIPSTVQELGDYAFYDSGLTSIVIPEGVTKLGCGSFAECNSLVTITVPSTVSTIPEDFVYHCDKLKTINFPKYSITEIDDCAFQKCISLEQIEIPISTQKLGYKAFEGDIALKSIDIPSQVSKMGENVFCGCIALSSVKLSAGLKEIPENTFYECTSLKEISVPYRVTYIGEYAFGNCYNLTTFNIPKSVTSISESAITYPALVTINGVNGSYAQTFANEYDINFVNKTVKTTGIKLHNLELLESKVINGNVGDEYSIICELLPVNSTEGVIWFSSNTAVATVDDDGNVEAKSGGKAVITAKSGTVSASFTVNVLVPLKTVSLNKSEIAFNSIGGYTTLTASKNPTDTSESIVWSSSNTAVATVDKNGKVVAKGYGTAVITAAGNVSSSVKATCNIKVNKIAIGTPVISSVKSLNYNQLQISFGKAANANGYIIYKYNSKTKEFEKIGTTSSTTYTDKTASIGSTSKYKVKAYHLSYGAYTYGAQSAEKSGKAVPKQVKRLKQSAYTTSSVTMKWTSLSGVSGYTIVRSSSAKGTYKSIKTLTSNVSSFRDTTCSAGTNYYYKVKAYKISSGGTKIYGDYSEPIKMTTKPKQTKLTLTNAGIGKIKISWLKASGSNGYELYMSTSKNGTYTKIKSANSSTLSYTKTGLNTGKKYYFKVKSYKTSALGAKYYSGFSDIKSIVVK